MFPNLGIMVITVLSSSINYLIVSDCQVTFQVKLFSDTYIHSKKHRLPIAATKVMSGISAAVGGFAQADYRIVLLRGCQDFG